MPRFYRNRKKRHVTLMYLLCRFVKGPWDCLVVLYLGFPDDTRGRSTLPVLPPNPTELCVMAPPGPNDRRSAAKPPGSDPGRRPSGPAGVFGRVRTHVRRRRQTARAGAWTLGWGGSKRFMLGRMGTQARSRAVGGGRCFGRPRRPVRRPFL